MKREAIGHTKLKRLCRQLDFPTWQGVGLLESTWHLTAREAPRGDLGKLSDADIALGIDYRGDEEKMINALVDTVWLDRHPVHRLVVHDWADHADDAIHMKLARNRLFFADGRAPKLSRLAGQEKEAATKFYVTCAQEANPSAQKSADQEPPAQASAQQLDTCAQNVIASALPEPRQSPAPPEPRQSPGISEPSESSGEDAVSLDSCPAFPNGGVGENQKLSQTGKQETAEPATENELPTRSPQSMARLMVTLAAWPLPEADMLPSELDKVLKALKKHSVDKFCHYLQGLPAKFQPTGGQAPRTIGFFISTARSYADTRALQVPTADRCEHGQRYGVCCNTPAENAAMSVSFSTLPVDDKDAAA